MKRGEWDRKTFKGVELQGKTLGLVGFGKIGQRVGVRARAFEMDVIFVDPAIDAARGRQLGAEKVTVDELVERADVVSFHCPLNPGTGGILSAERIARLRKGALVVNCGRGGVVDEVALLAALESGHLGGAALDVYEQEPPSRPELARHPRVVATPHIGAQTDEAQERIAVETANMVIAALAGDERIAAVNRPLAVAGRR
jgi:D-3-phosphoglycerate dehydrogenase